MLYSWSGSFSRGDRFGNRWEQDGPPPNPTFSLNNSNKIVGYSYSASTQLRRAGACHYTNCTQ